MGEQRLADTMMFAGLARYYQRQGHRDDFVLNEYRRDIGKCQPCRGTGVNLTPDPERMKAVITRSTELPNAIVSLIASFTSDFACEACLGTKRGLREQFEAAKAAERTELCDAIDATLDRKSEPTLPDVVRGVIKSFLYAELK